MNCISDSFDLSGISEYNVEAGRADTITAEKLKVIKQNGATRISINPQTFNNEVLKAIGRKHSAEDTINCFYLARDLGFDNINMDLIAGLSSDTLDSFINTINKITELSPENVTVHTLSLKRSADIFWKEKNLKENITQQMVEYSLNNLTQNGYKPYYLYRQKNTIGNQENVGYSKPNKEGLYNIYIMEETQTILAVGAASSTKLVHGEKKHERIFNYKFPYEYINSFDEMINRKNKVYDFFNS